MVAKFAGWECVGSSASPWPSRVDKTRCFQAKVRYRVRVVTKLDEVSGGVPRDV